MVVNTKSFSLLHVIEHFKWSNYYYFFFCFAWFVGTLRAFHSFCPTAFNNFQHAYDDSKSLMHTNKD